MISIISILDFSAFTKTSVLESLQFPIFHVVSNNMESEKCGFHCKLHNLIPEILGIGSSRED